MSGAHEAEAQLRGKLHGFAEGHGTEAGERLPRLLHGVKRKRRSVLGALLLVVEGRVFFLQVAGVGQHDAAQIDRGRSGVNRALEAFLVKTGNPSAVVQVSVGEDDGMDLAGGYGQVGPVLEAPLLGSLKESAIDQQLEARG